MRANASNWLELAQKILDYRRDELPAADRSDLQQKMEGLRAQLRERADASKLKLGIESLEGAMRKTGGTFYPKSTIQEYVEFFLVAAIVVLGLRTYIVQPFKIPTNSMWPSYYGMTPQVYQNPEDAPNKAVRLARLLMFGAQHHQVVAPESGPIRVPIDFGGHVVVDRTAKGRKWLIFPAAQREYLFYVGDKPIHFRTPQDFDFDWAFRDAFGLTTEEMVARARQSKNRNHQFGWVTLDQPATAGKPFLSFDVLSGDALFVDRMSYHFVRPEVGDGFVFRTKNIPALNGDQYYIKRLVGVPGDKIEIRGPALYRNGEPIEGAEAFARNAAKELGYRGYKADGSLAPGMSVNIDESGYLALGDNSYNSADSRYWGLVPKKDVAGRPLLIYYPFTRRWGPAP